MWPFVRQLVNGGAKELDVEHCFILQNQLSGGSLVSSANGDGYWICGNVITVVIMWNTNETCEQQEERSTAREIEGCSCVRGRASFVNSDHWLAEAFARGSATSRMRRMIRMIRMIRMRRMISMERMLCIKRMLEDGNRNDKLRRAETRRPLRLCLLSDRYLLAYL